MHSPGVTSSVHFSLFRILLCPWHKEYSLILLLSPFQFLPHLMPLSTLSKSHLAQLPLRLRAWSLFRGSLYSSPLTPILLSLRTLSISRNLKYAISSTYWSPFRRFLYDRTRWCWLRRNQACRYDSQDSNTIISVFFHVPLFFMKFLFVSFTTFFLPSI